jgi:alanine racemase
MVSVSIDLSRVRANVGQIRQLTSVAILAVVKADAYGLGCTEVATAIADLVDGFCVFGLFEAHRAKLWDVGKKRILVLGPPGKAQAEHFLAVHAQPAVSTVEQAERLRAAVPILSVDTGMQRFACPPEQIEAVLRAGRCQEAFTHATKMEHVEKFLAQVGGRGLQLHAGASGLISEPAAQLDAVRPGIAMYRGSVRVSTRLVEAKDSTGPAGYSGFVVPRFGVILCGYSHGLRPGPCSINGQLRQILEVGMQTSFVEIGRGDKVGDEAVLLGEGIEEAQLAKAWKCTEQEAISRLCGAGERTYGPLP